MVMRRISQIRNKPDYRQATTCPAALSESCSWTKLSGLQRADPCHVISHVCGLFWVVPARGFRFICAIETHLCSICRVACSGSTNLCLFSRSSQAPLWAHPAPWRHGVALLWLRHPGKSWFLPEGRPPRKRRDRRFVSRMAQVEKPDPISIRRRGRRWFSMQNRMTLSV